MYERRNIVILGASFSGLLSTHYILKHILPALKAKKDAKYHVYLIGPSTDLYFRIASPRAGASTANFPAEKLFFDIPDALKDYSAEDLTFLQATATGLDTTSRTVTYKKSEYLGDETLPYHALIVATGTKTHDPVYSQHTDKASTLTAMKRMNNAAASAKDIIITGGGPTAVESAGEFGELLNGRPGWFSTPERKVNITLITSASQLLPTLSPSIGALAEKKLAKLGVSVMYNTRVTSTAPAPATGKNSSSRQKVTLSNGTTMETDLYIPAHGVVPNSGFLPKELLDEAGYLKTNKETLRVDSAGPRVYALGDISSASRNTVMDMYDMHPVVMVNLKRDLMAYTPTQEGEAQAPGKDRIFKPMMKAMMMVPIGSAGGVGALFGWSLPNWMVWAIKSRDFMISWAPQPVVSGKKVAKEYTWSKEEAVY